MKLCMLALLGCSWSLARSQAPEPTPHPARPSPNWNWDTLGGTLAFHGANKTGMYTDAAVAQLSKYAMVTLEKWYTPCGSQGPTQAGPACDVEEKMFATFRALKARNPAITTVMYWNSNFDFAFYARHQAMLDLEAAGTPAFLRDMGGVVASLCNDGNVYCNITTFDHTQPAVARLWQAQVRNAVRNGSVDGIFADHAYNNPKPSDAADPTKPWQMCNGAGAGKACFDFTPEFGRRFTAAHMEMLNYTQDWLAKSTQGPVICGPLSRWNVHTDFLNLRKVVQKGQQDRTAPFVLEANAGGGCTLGGDESKLAGFLCAMEKFTYLSCFSSAVPTWYAAFDKPLGPPAGPAAQIAPGVWQRNFSNAKGVTVATYDAKRKTGTVAWAGEPTPPPTPPPPPPPAYCGTPMPNTGLANADLGHSLVVGSVGECCTLCHGRAKCVAWSWHTEQGGECHLHTGAAELHPGPDGCFSGYTNSSL